MLARLTAFSNAHELRESYPSYYQVKISVPLSESPPDWKALWNRLKAISPTAQAIEIDGLKLQWPQKWVHIRPSGTEPILRIYGRSPHPKRSRRPRRSVQKLPLLRAPAQPAPSDAKAFSWKSHQDFPIAASKKSAPTPPYTF